jgi:hypothetical protein
VAVGAVEMRPTGLRMFAESTATADPARGRVVFDAPFGRDVVHGNASLRK